MANVKIAMTTTHFAFKEVGDGRFYTPHGDPHEYEYPFDYMFSSREDALAFKVEHAPEERWALAEVTIRLVEWAGPTDSDAS